MIMELKNYAHLYAGLKYRTPWGIMVASTVEARKGWVWFNKTSSFNGNILAENGVFGRAFTWCEIKPILRPLSDITDAEARHIEEEWGSGWFMGDRYLTNALKDNQLAYVKKLGESFEMFHYLLSRHFDLFGLIAAGLAIDKTTIK